MSSHEIFLQQGLNELEKELSLRDMELKEAKRELVSKNNEIESLRARMAVLIDEKHEIAFKERNQKIPE